MAQEELEAPSAELADVFRNIEQTIAAGNGALDRFDEAVASKIDSGTQQVKLVREQVTGRISQLKAQAETLVEQLQSTTQNIHDTKDKCQAELTGLTASLSRFDEQIDEFLVSCRASLSQVSAELEALNGLIRTRQDGTQQRFEAWIHLIPGAREIVTRSCKDYAEVVDTLRERSDIAYKQLSSEAGALSQNTSRDLRALTVNFGAASASSIASLESGLGRSLSHLQQNATDAEQALDDALGKLERVADKIDDQAGQVLETVGKVADLLAAIKPVTDTLSAVV